MVSHKHLSLFKKIMFQTELFKSFQENVAIFKGGGGEE